MWSAGAFFVATLLASLVATGILVRLLRHYLVLDRPTGRSSHATPTLRGAGIVVVPVALIGWAATLAFDGLSATGVELAPVVAGCIIVGIISWHDDRRDLAPLWRLVAHATVIGTVIYWLPQPMQWPAQSLGGAIPNWVVLSALAVLLLWFVNAFNFMDGIDGITGVEAAAIGLGVLVLAGAGAAPERLGIWGAAIAGAAIGFLWWNWQPAKIFLGDVGSIPLGLLSGWLLLRLAMEGAWAAALILPAYYLADATLTLLRRAARGEKVWRAHREHFYQRAVQAGRSHAQVSLWVAAVNVVLIGLAVLSIDRPLMALAGAVLVVGPFLLFLSRAKATAA